MTSQVYDIYVFHRSYFCGKMLAYLRYKEIPHRAIYKSLAEVGGTLMKHTGLRQMPVVNTPDGEWLQDTTPMIEWFEQRFTDSPVLPKDPALAFLTRLLEDYADEYLWRPAIYYRWMSEEDRYMYKHLFVDEFVGGFWTFAKPLRWLGGKLVHKHQRDKFLYGDGMTEQNRAHVESVYIHTLERLEAIFQVQPYLLGDRPSMADFGFFGSMFWHFSCDPTSNRIMQERAPGVNEWVARMWNAKASRMKDASFVESNGELPAGWEPLLTDLCRHYLPYLETNAIAFAEGEKQFDWEVEGYRYPGVHVSPYRLWCRERLQQHLQALDDTSHATVQRILTQYGGWDALVSHTDIQSNWDPEGIAPLCKPGPVPLKHKLLARFTGTNHVRTERLWR